MSWLGVALPDGLPAFVFSRVPESVVCVDCCSHSGKREYTRVPLKSSQPVGPSVVVCARTIADPFTGLFAIPHP